MMIFLGFIFMLMTAWVILSSILKKREQEQRDNNLRKALEQLDKNFPTNNIYDKL